MISDEMETNEAASVRLTYRLFCGHSSYTLEILEDDRVRLQTCGKNVITTMDQMFKVMWEQSCDSC